MSDQYVRNWWSGPKILIRTPLIISIKFILVSVFNRLNDKLEGPQQCGGCARPRLAPDHLSQLYQTQATQGRPLVVLVWWKEHEKIFPNRAMVIQSVLSIPALSSASKRFFMCWNCYPEGSSNQGLWMIYCFCMATLVRLHFSRQWIWITYLILFCVNGLWLVFSHYNYKHLCCFW